MTVQTRIMLFIVGAGFLTSLLFSVVVFYEMIEQPFNLLDNVLQEEATRVVQSIAKTSENPTLENLNNQTLGVDQYWLEVSDQESNRVLFRSSLARQIQLAPLPPGSRAIVRPPVTDTTVTLPWQRDPRPIFRVRTFSLDIKGQTFTAQIGRPMEKLNEEIWELIFGLLAGLIFSILILCAISRYVAGKILQPVRQIKDLATEISEKNLTQRIPLRDPGDEINELAKTINLMLDRLQHSFERQRGFLFATSHELKTPLATIKLAVDNLLTWDTTSVSEQVWQALLSINNQVVRLERLVKDLLTLSSLETVGDLACRPVDLSALLTSLVEDYGFLAEDLHITINVNIKQHCVVHGDPDKLHRAFANIIDNALKFNIEGGRVDISCNHSDNAVIVTVVNTGISITEADLPQVFDQFYRGEKSRSTEHGGFGLGLAIVKKTIDLHRGVVTFENEEGQMTRVTIIIP